MDISSESDKEEKKEKKANRGRETLFRSAYQNQSNLIQLADNKANIIISINTMIISSIIAIGAPVHAFLHRASLAGGPFRLTRQEPARSSQRRARSTARCQRA